MDTSPEYIKMCEKAGEIQKDKLEIISMKDFYDIENKLVWLPRQDQLQDMIDHALEIFKSDLNQWSIDNALAIDDDNYIWIGYFDSLERALLAFIMHEKYNKKWNGEEWVNE
ncbi:MAG: hypothetical protein GY782_08595 [Gammaproteobacteria bacterium]|nr:hypothetical protein [Gammaproteobacteria bacterium]